MQDIFALKYLTSGTTSVSLKRKVFCAFHPDDSGLLEEVFQDLSRACECTLFYYESGKEPDHEEQLETDLKSMNLFVLIVTSDFLFKPCFANQVVYDFAVKHAIPVLPILFEGGLEEVFNEKIGNLQCLSKVQEQFDATTVPYREKLSNYLSQILSAELDMKRCCSAFDTSIFLSYRKKDRKYAQQLMELIHEDESCRNVAIWYDEFLVPGEDFNDGIKTELEESSLFVMVVTPHIVEGDNYITTTEYPMATSLKKTVLPFEMLPTDGKQLKAFCPGIQKTMNTKKGRKVRKAILGALNTMGIACSKNTAERNFLIGLAYLKGICVEKNSKVGFNMIAQAAEANVQEAVKTLVYLYRNAEGTRQDLDAASMWQNRLLADYQKDYEKDPCEEKALAVLKAYFELAQIQTQKADNEKAHETYRQIVAFCETEDLKDRIYAKNYAAMAHESSGKLWLKEGNYLEAQVTCFEEALSIRKELEALEPTVRSRLALIDLCESMAECCEEMGATLGVKDKVAYVKRLIAQVEDVEVTAENYDLIKSIMLCNSRLGHLYNVIDMWDASAACISKGISLAEKLCEISNTRESKRQLVLAYANEGERNMCCSVENRCKAALEAYQKACKIAEQLWSEKETLETQLDLAMINKALGHVVRRLESDEASVPYFENALVYLRSANRLTGTLPVKRALYRCCFAAAKIYQSMGNHDMALSLLRESEKVNSEVLDGFQFRSMRNDLAQTLAALGEWYKAQWEIDKALDYFQRSYLTVKRLWHENKTLRTMTTYSDVLKKYIATAKVAGDFELVDGLKAELGELSYTFRQTFG